MVLTHTLCLAERPRLDESRHVFPSVLRPGPEAPPTHHRIRSWNITTGTTRLQRPSYGWTSTQRKDNALASTQS